MLKWSLEFLRCNDKEDAYHLYTLLGLKIALSKKFNNSTMFKNIYSKVVLIFIFLQISNSMEWVSKLNSCTYYSYTTLI